MKVKKAFDLCSHDFATGAEEVVDMRGARLTQTYASEVLHCLWFGKVSKKKKKKVTTILTIAAHLTSYAFIADKLHKNPYIARYTLL